MQRPMLISIVKNGFIVSPYGPERHSEAKDEAIMVFETHEALFDYISKACVINTNAFTIDNDKESE